MIRTTAGQFLINDALPAELRDYSRKLDKKGVMELMRTVAQKHPDEYVKISKRLSDIGREAATESGGTSIGPEHLTKSQASVKYGQQIRDRLKVILANKELTPQQRDDEIIHATGSVQNQQMDEILEESLREKNPLALQVLSGSRGNKMNLASLRGSDLLYQDHHDNTIAMPVLRSYSQGLSPLEYWTGTYGARRGVLATKFAVRDAGFLSKQLNQVSHRLVVTEDDYDDEEQRKQLRGLPVATNDPDNEGALLAHDLGGYAKNTELTPKILKDLERRGFKRMLVRSPMVGGSPEGGLYARDVGIRERGVLPGRGEQIGLQAAQALSEPLSQAQLSAKHSGGVAGQEKSLSGFQAVNQLIQVPKVFKGGAAHSEVDGRVSRIEEAPGGGNFVTVDGQQHYVAPGFKIQVKPGDFVEAGDVLSEGLPDPSVTTHFKGVGEGKRYFVEAAYKAMVNAGMKPHRRNLEVLARGLINHVRLNEETDDNVPGDIVPYSTLEHTYKPRDGFRAIEPTGAVGKYLERPYLHYSIGTKIRPSMLNNFAEFGVNSVDVHDDPPPFEPEMVRGMYSLHHDPDWQTRFYGSGQKSSLLDAVHRGGTSTDLGTSFVPGLIRSVDFGRQGIVRSPEPGKSPMDVDAMRPKPISTKLELKPLKPAIAPSTDWVKAAEDERELLRAEANLRILRIKRAAAPLDPTGSSGASGSSAGNATPGTGTTQSASAPQGGQTQQSQPASASPSQTSASAGIGTMAGALGGKQHNPQIRATAQPGGGTSYDRYAQQRAGRYGGYQPGQGGLFNQTNDPRAIAQFITGGHEDHTQGYGGEFGSAMRFMTAIDPHAAATLTSGSPYAQGDYGDLQQFDPVHGGQAQGYGANGYEYAPEEAEDPHAGAVHYTDENGNPIQFGPEGPPPTWGDYGAGAARFAKKVPGVSNPIMSTTQILSDPMSAVKATGAMETANVVGKGISKVAPRVGNAVSTVSKAFSPVRQLGGMAGVVQKGSILTRGTAAVGGKVFGVAGGALNVGAAPAEALYHLYHGDTEAAKKMFYDEEYNRKLGDRNTSYAERVFDAADPSRFYNNAQNVGGALLSPVETTSGAFDNVAGLVGLDQQTRYNKYINTPEGKAEQARVASEQGRKVHAANTDWALKMGIGEMRDGQLHPKADWLANLKQHYPHMTPDDLDRHFLSTVYRWHDQIPGDNPNEQVTLSPQYMRQLYTPK